MRSLESIRKLKVSFLKVLEHDAFFPHGRLLKDYEVIISEKMLSSKRWGGETDTEDKVMIINPTLWRKRSLVRIIEVFVHECLHAMFPDFKENTIASLASKVAADLAPTEKMLVLRELMNVARWEE